MLVIGDLESKEALDRGCGAVATSLNEIREPELMLFARSAVSGHLIESLLLLFDAFRLGALFLELSLTLTLFPCCQERGFLGGKRVWQRGGKFMSISQLQW